ncbi:peptide methionine sulfoxide reductase MsrA [Fimicolochytrium jonesii]|uniref:peptide methionine sulfoxide reductase MsrA n=1 Tax=Fimicolochytrium jonesii TaxID=1396493 RepID=UPI0022FF04BA|nr:peptide methionine sulfoxide reductase MsrA [Fimicolochytrium jonesii]KAI8824559.1 peptide methionine sulfoxide reductase MsrA [Fimicolochytrium jonesii]
MGSTASQTPSGTGFPVDPTGAYGLATFGAGCFWGVEKSFKKKFGGDVDLLVGYAGGAAEQPTYRQVCSGSTGHAEALQVKYDTKKITYENLLDFFFRMHDPTTKNRQGGDTGTQYRSTILYHTPEQQRLAKDFLANIQHHFGKHTVVTTLEPVGTFWNAEDYHQDYLTGNPHGYECPTHFERSWERIHEIYGGQ